MTARLDDIGRDALRDVAPDIVVAFRGQHNRALSSRKEMRWGRKGSLALVIAGPKEGCWYDHETGRGGDIIAFIEHELNCTFIDAIDYASRFVGGLRERPKAKKQPQPDADSDADDAQRVEDALAIWCDAGAVRKSLGEDYLGTRGIKVPDEALDVVRFHPRCPWSGTTRPALVALIRDIFTDEPIGIQRIALSRFTGTKIGCKAKGLKKGGAIKFTVAGAELLIGEGIETTLSAPLLGDFTQSVWSVIDADGIAQFPVLPGIDRLIIAVDNDASGTGQKAANECKTRWTMAGRSVCTVTAKKQGDDLNDVLKRRLRMQADT